MPLARPMPPAEPPPSAFDALLTAHSAAIFAYLWRFGYLDWVRSAATTSIKADYRPGVDLRKEARIDRA